MDPFLLLLVTILATYFVAFVSGFTDAANSIATAVGSRSLSPRAAIIMAAVLETVGALTGTAVALTIGKNLVNLGLIPLSTVLATLVGTMSWTLFTYKFGIPVSETHGLVGAVIGASIGAAGTRVILWDGLIPVLLAVILAPLFGFLLALLLMHLIYRFFQNAPAGKTIRMFRSLQQLSAAFMAFSHGRNDAQKPMGILVMALAIYYGWSQPTVPLWVILSVSVFAGLGIAYGGWRIIRTVGFGLTPLSPEQGFTAQTSAGMIMQAASSLGIPVSTTHTITSSVMGAGAAKRVSSVRWSLAFEVLASWILTLPATMILGWGFSVLLMIP